MFNTLSASCTGHWTVGNGNLPMEPVTGTDGFWTKQWVLLKLLMCIVIVLSLLSIVLYGLQCEMCAVVTKTSGSRWRRADEDEDEEAGTRPGGWWRGSAVTDGFSPAAGRVTTRPQRSTAVSSSVVDGHPSSSSTTATMIRSLILLSCE